ncbi:MAG TPA: L,D-transpeptidase family protein [Candidatus Binataceae bacterium]|nr:L,D-transpeptidase family protein [Candidatus Binataceae bacterium]
MHHKRSRLWSRVAGGCAAALVLAGVAVLVAPRLAHSWTENDFETRPLVGYAIPGTGNDIIGSLQTYTIRKGDTLLDVARWYGLSPTEVSNANNHMDWWSPPVGKLIVIPTEHILPAAPHAGIVMNIPEMRLYYYYPTPVGGRRRIGKAKFTHTAYAEPRHPKKHGKAKAHAVSTGAHPTVIYTFPVGLGRYDWRTPTGVWTIRDKTHNPTWVVPDDIYQEHLERDGEAEHVVDGGDPDNPLGHYRLALTLPMYALHGTNVPWGVGMEVSHGCVRLYPEDIERLYYHTSVGTPGRFVYQPVKYGWRNGWLYVEVHEDLYGMYPGLWRYALSLAKSQDLLSHIELVKLEKAVEEKTGVPTYIMPGPDPAEALPPTTETASTTPLPAPGSAASAPDADTSVGGGASPGTGSSVSTDSDTDNDTEADTGGETGKTAAAIPAAPRSNAIRTAPAPAADDNTIDDSEGDMGTSNANAAPDNAADTDDSEGNSPNEAAPSGGDASQWRRLPTGALPLE